MSSKDLTPVEVALAFDNVSIASLLPPKPMLSNVSGFIKKGGITAVFGPSASGKSLLLQALAGRIKSLSITGKIFLNGVPIDPASPDNGTCYVPQGSMLIGDLTAKEMVRNAAMMKKKAPRAVIEQDVAAILEQFGLTHVADTYIGTLFRAGLSGGQKRRVDVACELVSAPAVAFLDEPTSGLDGSIAFDVLSAIKGNIAAEAKRGKDLSIMLSIHQPNARILGLFDHILVLGANGETFFGTLQESITHFTELGFPPPAKYTPTDFYLKIADSNFSVNKYDFIGGFNSTVQFFDLAELLNAIERRGVVDQLMAEMAPPEDIDPESANGYRDPRSVADSSANSSGEGAAAGEKSPLVGAKVVARKTSFFTQIWVLIKRDFIVASRDPTLYFLQIMLTVMFGFLIGAVFFQLPYRIDATVNVVPSALLWAVMMMMYIHVFKVYHLMKGNERYKHERTNNSYTPFAAWTAELLSVGMLLLSYLPAVIMLYFMVGLPSSALAFMCLLFWTSAVTAESMLSLLSKFFTDISTAVVASQLLLVVLTAFGAGLFIAWQDTPAYWEWLQALSIFNHATRAAMLSVMRKITYECVTAPDGVCYGPGGEVYNCENGFVPIGGQKCDVTGSEVLRVSQSVDGSESYWTSYGYLVALLCVFRVSGLVLLYYPAERMTHTIIRWCWYNPHTIDELISARQKIILLEQRVLRLVQCSIAMDECFRPSQPVGGKGEGKDMDNDDGDLPGTPTVPFSEENPLIASVQRSKSLRGRQSSHPARKSSIKKGFLDFEQVDAEHQYEVEDKEKIGGTDVGTVVAGSSDRLLRLSWTNLNLVLKKGGKTLIDNVSGDVVAGRVLALMGPSGAGKTTLLNALASRAPYAHVTGDVKFGGLPLTSKDLMYVPQFDEIKGYTTVMEQIRFVGLMKCRDVRKMQERLVKLLQVLGLFDKANVLCKELTGGELKRVSVGMGMISNPHVLFLDEPSTGLDSTAAYFLVSYMVNLAKELNVPVIMTIHQPAAMVFDMLQDLYLLEGGRLAYFGPIAAAAKYFNSLGHPCPAELNPADFYLDLIYKAPDETHAKAGFTEWRQLFQASSLGGQMAKVLVDRQAIDDKSEGILQDYDEPSGMSRFITITSFFLRYYAVNPGYYWNRILYLIVCAVYTGTLFLELDTNTDELREYSGAVFFSIWITLFSAIGSTALIAADRWQSFEQIKNGVITPALYCLAQFLASLPYNMLCAVLFQALFHWLTAINPSGASFIYAIAITFLHLVMMEGIMNIVVEIVKDAMLSVTLAMLILGALFMLPGFFRQTDDMPAWISWMSWMMPTKYSFDGYLHVIFEDQDFKTPSGIIVSGDTILEDSFGNTDTNPGGMIGVLIAYVFLFRIAHYALFLYASRPFLMHNNKAATTSNTAGETATAARTAKAGGPGGEYELTAN